jgi:transposase InsO family protein
MSRKVITMEQKLAVLFAAVAAGHKGVTQACREADISRDTYYRLRRGWETEGLAGLLPRSRAPHHSPTRTSDEVVELIVTARKQLEREGWDNGAISIHCRLMHDGLDHPPCARTIHRVLTRAGMIEPEPGKRPRSSFKRFVFPATDDCWNIDAFGYRLADPASTLVSVFEIYDDHSRSNIADLAWPREDTEGAWTAMTMGIDRYGPPRMALADNGLAFTGRCVGIQVLFEKNLALLGIKLINSRPRHPQTNGKNERAHATARRWLAAQPPATTLEELQTLLERYRLEYNNRPHQGIDLDTPLQRRLAGTRPTPPATDTTTPTTTEPATQVIEGRATSRDGYLATQNTIIPLGVEYAGQPITAFITGNHALVFYREQLIRELTLDRTRKRQPPLRPRSTKRRTLTYNPQP